MLPGVLTVFTSAALWLIVALTTPLITLAGAGVFLATAPFDPGRRALHAFLCAVTFGHLRLNPAWRIRFEGREHLPRGPAVLVVNHQSMMDVVVMMGLGHPFKFVSKASLFELPLVGWLMRLAAYVSIERGRPKSTHRMMEACRGWLRRGESLLIFPEGTYGKGGELLPFRPGAFVLATQERVPVVPIALSGTTGLMRPDSPWVSPRCQIRVRVLPPVWPREGQPPRELAAEVRALIAQALESERP